MTDRINNTLPSPEELKERSVLRFQNKLRINEDLPACASCGMRLLLNDHYERISLDNLEKLKYTELQRVAHYF